MIIIIMEKNQKEKKNQEKLFSFHFFMSLLYATVLQGHPLPHNVQSFESYAEYIALKLLLFDGSV